MNTTLDQHESGTMKGNIILLMDRVDRILKIVEGGNGEMGLVKRVGAVENEVKTIVAQHNDERVQKQKSDDERRKFFYGIGLIIAGLVISNIWLGIQILLNFPTK